MLTTFASILATLLLTASARAQSNDFQCPDKFGHFADPMDCSKYYVCNHGRGLSQNCDPGLLYNVFLKTCDWPRNVRCDRGGKRENTKRNPDLQKTHNNRHKEFEETNHLNSEDNDYDNPSYDRNQDLIEAYSPNKRRPAPQPPAPQPRSFSPMSNEFPKWNQDITVNQRPQGRGPAHSVEIGRNNHLEVRKPTPPKPLPSPPVEERDKEPNHDYDFDIPDYYEYEEEEPVRHVRQPVKEAEEKEEPKPVLNRPQPVTPAARTQVVRDNVANNKNKEKERSVKRIGWLPEDNDSNEMDQYHWSKNDAVDYSKDKPRMPDEAYVSMKDFRDTERQLEEDNSPNVGPPPEEDEDYSDYYEDDEPPIHDEEEERPPPNDDDREEPPPPESGQENPNDDKEDRPTKKVRYDDDEEVHPPPRVGQSAAARPPVRNQLSSPPAPQYQNKPAPQPKRYNPRGGEPFTRIQSTPQSADDDSGLRTNVKPYASVPKVVSPDSPEDQTTDQITKPKSRTNIHYKNVNSPYLRPVLDQERQERDRQEDRSDNENKGVLIKSVPRHELSSSPKRRVVIRKVVKKRPPLAEDRSESVTPSIYQLLDDYRSGLPSGLPDAILTHKKKAQEFRDSLIDNYMNNEKPNYIVNDNDFDNDNSYDGPTVSGEGDESEHVRDFEQDFSNGSDKPKKESDKENKSEDSRADVRQSSHSRSTNRTENSETGVTMRDRTTEKPSKGQFLNTDAIVKQQRAHIPVSGPTADPPPADKKPVTKKPVINSWPKPLLNDYEAPKRTPFGFKQSVIPTVVPRLTTTTAKPKTTRKPSVKPKTIRIKTPKPKPVIPASVQTAVNPPRKPALDPQWYQNINYEPKPSTTDLRYVTASKCDHKYCQLPDCRCGGTDIPGGYQAHQIPQIIMLTFDDSVNDLNWDIYDELFNGKRKNPNGCPISATFYVSHEWTDYAQVQTLYANGHEMASHSITHSFGEKFSKELWLKEIGGQRELLRLYGGVKERDVRGMRAPFLQTGGNTMFEMLYESNFTYDSSLPVYEISPPYFPYTLDYAIGHECMITPCPTKSFPGMWEVGMVMWEDMRGGRCSMADACFNPRDEETVYEMVKNNFNRHYNSNRAPFGIYFHSRWFLTEHNRKGFIKFLDEMTSMKDVFFVTNWQMIQWMRDPQPLNKILNFKPWLCDYRDRPPQCERPNECKVKFRSETRVLKTCQPCPKTYPWRSQNGLRQQ